MDSWELVASVRQLPETFDVDLSHPKVLPSSQLPLKIQDHIDNSESSVKHVVKDQTEMVLLLERYGKSYCICWPVVGCCLTDFSLQDVHHQVTGKPAELDKDWNKLQFKELLNQWRETHADRLSDAPIRLNMRLPESLSSQARNTQIDMTPESYLETKYFESLFFIHLPLAYFVKSNLERFKSMCRGTSAKDPKKAYKKCLFSKLLANKEFDQRHENNKLLKAPIKNDIATERRGIAFSKYLIADEDTLLQDFATILRIREIKLQIILLLENIYIDGLDSNFKDFETKYRSRLKARSLNVTRLVSRRTKKNRSKRLGDSDDEPKFDCCEQLDLYLDKLCILDVLLASEPFKVNNNANVIHEHKQSILNRSKEASSLGFANLVLVPYFTRKAPNAISFIVHKLRGPRLKTKKPSRRKNTVSEHIDNFAENYTSVVNLGSRNSSIVSPTPSSPDGSNTPASLHHMISPTPECINSRTYSNLDSFFEGGPPTKRVPSFISRTSSDLTMNHLEKRQLSVTEFTSQKSVSAGRSHSASAKRASSSFTSPQQSFCRVGKRKIPGKLSRSMSNVVTDQESDSVQVMSTPLKRIEKVSSTRVTLQNIVESPVNTLDASNTQAKEVETSPDPTQNLLREVVAPTKPTSRKIVRRRLFAP